MGKNLKYLITIILIIIYLAFSFYPNVKTFDEIALNYYKDKDFDEVWLFRDGREKTTVKYEGENSEKIKELLDYLGSFKYVNIPYHKATPEDDISYEIRLYDNTTQDVLEIEINNKEQIKIGLHYQIKEINEDNNSVSYITNNGHSRYQVYKNGIDKEYIEDYFQSLESTAR